MKIHHSILAIALLSAPIAAAVVRADDQAAAKPAQSDAAVIAAQLPSYPLDTCPVSGEPVEDAVNRVLEGRLVRLCCESCIKVFEKDPKAIIEQVDRAVIAKQKPSYPLKVCAVSDEELGSMGDPIDHVHGTRLVRFCCKSCTKSFQRDPEKYMAKVDAALIEQQRPSYPLETCLLSGEPLGEDGADTLYGTRLVRFCCSRCAGKFQASPEKYLAQLDAAGSKKKTEKGGKAQKAEKGG